MIGHHYDLYVEGHIIIEANKRYCTIVIIFHNPTNEDVRGSYYYPRFGSLSYEHNEFYLFETEKKGWFKARHLTVEPVMESGYALMRDERYPGYNPKGPHFAAVWKGKPKWIIMEGQSLTLRYDPLVPAKGRVVLVFYLVGAPSDDEVARIAKDLIKAPQPKITPVEEVESKYEKLYKKLVEEHYSLKEDYEKLKEEHNSLTEKLKKLTEDYEELNEVYYSLKEDYNRLKREYEVLRELYKKVEENYGSLREVHEKLKVDYDSLNYQIRLLIVLSIVFFLLSIVFAGLYFRGGRGLKVKGLDEKYKPMITELVRLRAYLEALEVLRRKGDVSEKAYEILKSKYEKEIEEIERIIREIE